MLSPAGRRNPRGRRRARRRRRAQRRPGRPAGVSAHAQIESLRRQLRSGHRGGDRRERRRRGCARCSQRPRRRRPHPRRGRGVPEQTRLGADDAAERIRANARAEADQIVEAATRRHAEADETFRRRIAEADRYRAEITERTEARPAARGRRPTRTPSSPARGRPPSWTSLRRRRAERPAPRRWPSRRAPSRLAPTDEPLRRPRATPRRGLRDHAAHAGVRLRRAAERRAAARRRGRQPWPSSRRPPPSRPPRLADAEVERGSCTTTCGSCTRLTVLDASGVPRGERDSSCSRRRSTAR